MIVLAPSMSRKWTVRAHVSAWICSHHVSSISASERRALRGFGPRTAYDYAGLYEYDWAVMFFEQGVKHYHPDLPLVHLACVAGDLTILFELLATTRSGPWYYTPHLNVTY